jgi:transcriptional regulator with XRE-family HTH domain
MSQETLAGIVGIGQGGYSMIELGERRPSVDTAKKIAAALGFDWTRFFEDGQQAPIKGEAL